VATDPMTALETLARVLPSVAVVDIGMPLIDGYELAARMRQTGPGQRCRLIALTGYGQQDDRARSKQAGFELHFVKPVDLDALLRGVDAPA
jgi:CheY-like chemotaxis protein